MAPLIRCRNFNPDGTVRQPCRFGQSCSWIHPDDPLWDSARNSNFGEFRHHDSRGGREGPNSRSTFGTRGAQKSSASASSPIDHGWGPPQKQTQGQSDKPGWGSSKVSVDQPVSLRTASGFPDNAWGSSSSKITGENQDTRNGWGSTNNGWTADAGGGKGKGIASKDEASGWGVSSSGGWGNLDPATSDKGWGTSSDNEGRGKTDKASTAWSSWGSSTKNTSTNETNTGDRGWNASNDWDTRAKPPDPRRPLLPTPRSTEKHKDNSCSLTPQLAISSMTAPLPQKPPLPGPKSSSSTSALLPTTDKGIPDVRTSLKIKTKGIDPSESTPSGVPNSARPRETPLTRSRIQSNTIRYTLQAVRLQLELDDARANVERWKRLRSSAQFTRATPLTQNIINDQRLVYGQNEKELENQLHATIRYLADLPQLTTQADLVSAEADEQDLVEYTAQLRDWIGGLEALYRALFCPETNFPPSPTVTERPKHLNEIVWDRIETLVQSVDDNISFIEDVLYKDIQADVVSRAAALRDDRDEKRLSEAKDKAEKLLKEANQIGFDLEVLVAETAKLLTTIHENRLALDNLCAELDNCQQTNQQLAGYLQQLEHWKEEDSVSIERLTRQIKSLYTKKRPTRVPFDQEELKEQITKSTLKKMTEQVYSLFNTIQEAAKNNSQTFAGEILKQLDPILETTYEVCQRAEAITSRFPIPS